MCINFYEIWPLEHPNIQIMNIVLGTDYLNPKL